MGDVFGIEVRYQGVHVHLRERTIVCTMPVLVSRMVLLFSIPFFSISDELQVGVLSATIAAPPYHLNGVQCGIAQPYKLHTTHVESCEKGHKQDNYFLGDKL